MKIDSARQLPVDVPPSSGRLPGAVDRWARALVMRQLNQLRQGEITIHDFTGKTCTGTSGDINVAIEVHDPRFYRAVALGGSLGAAKSYIQGGWECSNLTELFRLFVGEDAATRSLSSGRSGFGRIFHRLTHALRANSRSGSRKNIHAHYDLGNDFFGLWLDDTWAYSCGVFPTVNASLQDASVEKFDLVCRKLDLQPDDHLLEIGTGWGGLALHAARHYGCRVTTTTISQQQYQLARNRIAAAGLGDQITLLQRDYRELQGRYDKLVSIEMVEAVGHRYLDAYFRKCSELLTPEGTMLLQAIIMPEQNYAAYLRSVDFIRRYVFPGGNLPSMSSMLEAVGRTGSLRLVQCEDFAPHYEETLKRWRSNFYRHLAEIRGLGYPEELIRLWDYYLCYCEAAFAECCIGVVQVQFDNNQRRRPLLLPGNKCIRESHAQETLACGE